MTEAFERALIYAGDVQDLPPGGRKLVFVPGGESVVLLNVDGEFFALENSCPHAGASIASGACDGRTLSCPAHGLKFNLRSGECTASAQLRVPVYEVVRQNGELWLCSAAPDLAAEVALPVPV